MDLSFALILSGAIAAVMGVFMFLYYNEVFRRALESPEPLRSQLVEENNFNFRVFVALFIMAGVQVAAGLFLWLMESLTPFGREQVLAGVLLGMATGLIWLLRRLDGNTDLSPRMHGRLYAVFWLGVAGELALLAATLSLHFSST